MIEVEVKVLLQVDCDGQLGAVLGESSPAKIKAAVEQAIRGALSYAEQGGFCHDLADDVSIAVVSIDAETVDLSDDDGADWVDDDGEFINPNKCDE